MRALARPSRSAVLAHVPERPFRDDGSLSLRLKMLEELAKAPIERGDLALVERTEEAPDVRGVLGHRRVDRGEALVGESDAEAAPIRRIKCAFDVASGLQPVQPARHAGATTASMTPTVAKG